MKFIVYVIYTSETVCIFYLKFQDQNNTINPLLFPPLGLN